MRKTALVKSCSLLVDGMCNILIICSNAQALCGKVGINLALLIARRIYYFAIAILSLILLEPIWRHSLLIMHGLAMRTMPKVENAPLTKHPLYLALGSNANARHQNYRGLFKHL